VTKLAVAAYHTEKRYRGICWCSLRVREVLDATPGSFLDLWSHSGGAVLPLSHRR